MSRLTRLSTDERNNLVAYLDGELEDDATQRIEEVLSQSPVARNDVELLVKTYDLLDLLPRPKASAEFTQKTIATARMTEVKVDYADAARQKTPRSHAGHGGRRARGGGGFAGFAAANRFVPLRVRCPASGPPDHRADGRVRRSRGRPVPRKSVERRPAAAGGPIGGEP